MADDWENEDFEPPPVVLAVRKDDRWEGEDEEDAVKESWEDEEEESKQEDVQKPKDQTATSAKNKKKKLEEKIAEKERRLQEELAKKAQQNGDGVDSSDDVDLTPEEKLAERLRRQKMQEEADIMMARDTFGIGDAVASGVLDSLNPSSKEEFLSAKDALVMKLRDWQTRPGFSDFAEEFVRDICATLDVDALKKISLMTKAFHEEKLKMSKQASKSKAKGKKVATLKHEKDDAFYSNEDLGGEFDDFM